MSKVAAKNNGQATIEGTAREIETGKPSEQPVDALIIQIIRHENGQVTPVISLSGDVRITEVEGILRLARNEFLAEKKIAS